MIEKLHYNTIIVIESLDNSLDKTGTKLYELIKIIELKYPGVKTLFYSPNTKIDFIKILSCVNDFVQNQNCLPIIHLEIHGNKNGVQCANSDFITWEELYPYFIDINVKLKNTLIITSSICFGAYFYFNIDINKPAPFFTLISSNTKINNEIILESYEGFYNELLYSENINNALNHLNLNFLRPTDNGIISEIFIQDLLNEYKKLISSLPGLINFSIIDSKKIISETDKNHFYTNVINVHNELFINKLKEIWFTYLMLDLYPETKNRYKSIKDICLENINKIDINKELKADLIKEVSIQLG